MTLSYLDNSATTPLCPAAKQKMAEAMEVFGNPSSLHSLGMEGEKLVSEARDRVFTALGAKKVSVHGSQIVLTKHGNSCIFCDNTDDLVIFEDKKICKSCLEKLTHLS